MERDAGSQHGDEDRFLFEHIMGGIFIEQSPNSLGDSFQIVGYLEGNKFPNFL